MRPARDARRRLADPRPVPVRRLVAPERRAHADPQAEARRLPVARLLHDRLTWARSRSSVDSARAAPVGTRPRRRRATSSASRTGTGSSSAASSSSPRAANTSRPPRRPRRSRSPRWRRPAPRTSTGHRGGARGVRERLVDAPPVRARQVPVPDRAHPAGAVTRARGRRVARRRQADQGIARRRPPLAAAHLLLRGLGGQARSTHSRIRGRDRSASPRRSSRGTSRC